MSIIELDESNSISALLIEDNEDDADLLRERLSMVGATHISIEWAGTLKQGLERLERQKFDVLLLDLSLPDSFSIDTLKKCRATVPDVPIIIMAGMADQELGLLAVKEGAQDYLVKGQVGADSIHRVIRYAIERKKIELLLQQSAMQSIESEAKLRLAMASSQLAPWLWQLDQALPEFDDRSATVFGGMKFDSLEAFLQVIHESERAIVAEAIELARIDGAQDLEIEFRVVWPDQSQHWIRMLGQRIADVDSAPRKLAGICKEITRSKEQEDAVRRLALLKQKEEFMALLAHDLRNPIVGTNRILSHIIGSVKDLPPRVKAWLADVYTSQQSLLQLINNVMDSYRLDSQQGALFCTETSVQSIVETIVAECKLLAEWNNLTISSKIQSANRVAADSQAMHRVLGNLINNAIKFTPAGGTIEVNAFDQDDVVVIEVKDSGAGIESTLVEKIFEPFFQTRVEHRASGTGLGLHLCKMLLEAQGASISCQSSLGKGTTFSIKLPRFNEAEDLQSHAVLIVSHDCDGMRSKLAQIFTSAELEYDVVPDQATAFLYAKTGTYAAIFIEIGLSEDDDIATAKGIRGVDAVTPIFGYGNSLKNDSVANAGFEAFCGQSLGRTEIEKACANIQRQTRLAS